MLTPFLLQLPTELLLVIAAQLNICSLSRLSRTCNTFYHLLAPTINTQLTRDALQLQRVAITLNLPALLSRAIAAAPNQASSHFILAIISRYPRVVRVFLDHIAELKLLQPGDRMPLHFALQFGRLGAARMLLEEGAWWEWWSRDDHRTGINHADLDDIEKLLVEFGGIMNEDGVVVNERCQRGVEGNKRAP